MKRAPTPWKPHNQPDSFLVEDADGVLVCSSAYHEQIIHAVNTGWNSIELTPPKYVPIIGFYHTGKVCWLKVLGQNFHAIDPNNGISSGIVQPPLWWSYGPK